MSRTIDGTFGTRNADPLQVRPYNFGTDAIERQRVSLGQSIIDADFEYGLQGTKWQTYQEIRKFPGFYETPGTDLTVTSITSDNASPSVMTVQLTTVATGTSTLSFTTSGTTSTGTVTLGTAIAIPIGSYLVGLSGGIAGPVYVSANTTAQSYTVTYRSQVATNLSAVSFAAVANQSPDNGSVISVTGLVNSDKSADRAEGFFLTTSVVTATGTFTYTAKQGKTNNISGAVSTPYTVIRRGGIFNNGACRVYQTSLFQTLNTVVVNTSDINGLVPGTPICVTGTTGGVGTNGNFFVDTIYTSSQFSYTTASATAGTLNATIFTIILTIGLATQGTLSSVATTAMDAAQLSTIGITGGGGTMTGSLSSIGASSAVLTITGGTTAAKTFGIAAASTAIQGTASASTTGGSPFAPTTITLGLSAQNTLALTNTISAGNLNAICGSGASATGTITAVSAGSVTITFSTAVPTGFTIAANATTITTDQATTGTMNGTSTNVTGTQALSAGTGSLLANQTVTTIRLNTIGITCGTSTATITAVSVPSVTLSITPAPTNTAFTFGTSGGNPLRALAGGTISGTITLRRVTIGLSAQGSLVDGFTMGLGGINQLGITGTGIITSTLSGTSASATTLTIAGMNTTDALNVTQAASGTSVIFSNQLAGTILIYVQPYSSCVHRPFDGGVLLYNGQSAYGSSTCRQSKKVFRYQSGKGLLWSSGTLFCPNNDIVSVTSDGTVVGSNITIVTDVPHGSAQKGATIQLRGIKTSGFDGTYVIDSVTESTTVIVKSVRTLDVNGTALLSDQPRFIMSGWHGASVRAGCFEDQNGLFWEYDGQTLWAVKRSSTFQLAGTVYIALNSQVLNGTGTRFIDQLRVGQRITIRGMTHTVTSITSDTVISVTPPWRGAAAIASGQPVKACKIIEVRVPQSLFNQDTIDGKGKSGYKVDLAKMQMIGLQYTWYGAGFVDFMIRGGDGNWVYAHRFTNNNVNDEAYMRTGNMPVRYEIINESTSALSRLNGGIDASVQTLTLEDDLTYWPSSGTVMVDQELISYAAKTSNTLTGCARGTSLSYNVADVPKTFSGAAAVAHLTSNSVNLISCTCSPSLTHWGSAFIMDGQFDNDRGYFFNYTFNQTASITAGTTVQVFFLRLAPSVSNGLIGDIGSRDLLNRAQLLLQQLDVAPYGSTAGGSVNVTGILNPAGFESSTFNWQAVNSTTNGSQPSFCQVAVVPTTGTYVAGSGERVFSTLAQSGSMNSLNLSALKELSSAIIGGNRIFPDGPDTLMIQIQALNVAISTCVLNLYWSEAQA